jgi:CHASE2 domain-containing sensor protein
MHNDADLATLPSLEEEYRAAARLIREAFELGAATVVFDIIYARGTETMGEPILKAMAKGEPVVLAEAIRQAPGSEKASQRLRSFPSRPARVTPAGLVNTAADPDGVHRVYSLLHWTGNAFEPSLALAAWLSLRGVAWNTDVKQAASGTIRWPELSADGNSIKEAQLVELAGRPRLLNFRGAWSDGAGFGHLTLRGLDILHGESAEPARSRSPERYFLSPTSPPESLTSGPPLSARTNRSYYARHSVERSHPGQLPAPSTALGRCSRISHRAAAGWRCPSA